MFIGSEKCGCNCTSQFFTLSDPTGNGQRELSNKTLAACKPRCYLEVTTLTTTNWD